jgi:hypothetical protein
MRPIEASMSAMKVVMGSDASFHERGEGHPAVP